MKIPFVLIVTLAMACDALGGGIAAGVGTTRRTVISRAALAGIAFGCASFAALMLGRLASLPFAQFAVRYGRYAAAALLAYLGIDMMLSSVRRMRVRAHTQEQSPDTPKRVLVLALTTSLNKLAAGAAFGLLANDALFTSGLTGIASLLLAAVGGFFTKTLGRRAAGIVPFGAGALVLGVGLALAADKLLLGGIL